MKLLLAISLLIFSFFAVGQQYKLFNASTHKTFTNYPLPDSTMSIAFDSVNLTGADSVYYNFTQPGIMITSNNCQFWGGPQCIKQDFPTWPGSKIVFNNSNNYKFYTNSGEVLNFNFTVNAGQPAIFYENATEKFFFTFTHTDTLTVLGITDSARFYTISHTNISGTTINSLLNGKNIIIAKNLGLVQFFQVDFFPHTLNPLYLLGQQSPELGINALTNAMLYDYEIGDVFQYREQQLYNYSPPEWNYDRFIRYTILSKNYTADSIMYLANKYVFDKGASTANNDQVTLKYKTNGIVTQAPFEYTNPDAYLFINRFMRFEDYCDASRWTYHEKPEYSLGYCENENCWGARDSQGPPPYENTIYTCGLGIYKSEYSEFAFYPTDPGRYYLKELIYYKKNGISCGNEAFVGLDKKTEFDDFLSVYPIPSGEFITVETSAPEGGILSISTITGKKIYKQQLFNKTTKIEISQFNSGLYLITLNSGKSVSVRKFIKK